jgi:hypothetical protein
MAKLTLFWMDIIRNRLKTFPFKSSKDKQLVKDFLAPVLEMGKEEEFDIEKKLQKSIRETRIACRKETGKLTEQFKHAGK